ncbi:MAG: preprotein translocase subunit YajC [Alcanivoracaceae bacterium]|nr:preprotein translocase subunit YajC [Alcanivoracaceae bacterium]
MSLFIQSAYAADTAAQAPGNPGEAMFSWLMIGGMMVLFYFLLIRPQNKRAKEHRELVGAIAKGDEVITSGGMLGKVAKVTDEYVVIEIANGLEIKLQKASVQATLPKGTIKSI